MIIGKAISPFAIKRRNGGGGNDADAQAFITASGISGTNATAINQLVIDLKAANIWTKMKAVYPFVGNTASSQKWNLKDARDLNAAYRLFFGGGVTFSATGIQFNGTNSYANTFLTPSTSLTSSNNHLSVYNRTNTAASVGVDIGSYSAGSPILYCSFYSRFTADLFILANGNSTFPSVANANSQGMYIMSKLSASNTSGYKNNTKLINAAASGTGISSQPLFIGAQNNTGVAGNFNNREIAFASIGDGLTDAEALAFYNAVQTFNTTLGRQV
jgi:hypothetical protein